MARQRHGCGRSASDVLLYNSTEIQKILVIAQSSPRYTCAASHVSDSTMTDAAASSHTYRATVTMLAGPSVSKHTRVSRRQRSRVARQPIQRQGVFRAKELVGAPGDRQVGGSSF